MLFPRQIALLAFLLSVSQVAPATPVRSALTPFEASYTVTAKGFRVGVMTRKLEIVSGLTYRFSASFQTTGLAAAFQTVVVSESSAGEVVKGALRPLRYRYRKESRKKIEESGVDFDWTLRLASGFKGKQRWQLPLTGNEVDKVIYQFSLAYDLLAGADVLNYTVADAGKRQQFLLRKAGEEVLSLPAGDVATIRVEHRRRDGRGTTLWCDPARAYLPVQIEYREKDGSLTRAQLDRLIE